MEDREIMVSISCITYNHAPYIRQCLDGFLMQKTNFNFEVLIHDDASIDGTTEIIKEYETRYPDIIKPMYEEENQWVKGRRGSKVFNFPRAKGKYIAMCEGDDYWIDPLKLQKQVDFLENNPNCQLLTHGAKLIEASTSRLLKNHVISSKVSYFSIKDAILGYGHKTCTMTFMFRRGIVENLPSYVTIAPCSDYVIPILAASYGDICNIPDIMASHRVLVSKSMTNEWKEDFNKRKEYNYRFERMLSEIDLHTNHKFSEYIEIERLGLWFRSYMINGDIELLKDSRYKKYLKTLSFRERFISYLKIYFPTFYKIFKNIYLSCK